MNGALLEDAKRVLDTQEEGDLMGHPWRFEQLCRATGRLRVGDETHEIDGGANRIRRQSIRRQAKLRGHAWQACLLPSGRAFGYIAYPPRDDGKDTYNEGYLFEGDGDLVPARVVEAPWLRTLTPQGEDVSCVLETEDGRTGDDHRRDGGVDVHGDAAGRGRRRHAAAAGHHPVHLGRRERQRHARAIDRRLAKPRVTILPTLLATAQERTGLADFGDDSFREGLERLVHALRDGGDAQRRSARSCSPS